VTTGPKNPAIAPSGRKPSRLTASRIAIYVGLALLAIVFFAPIYVMIVTSLKSMDEIRTGWMLAPPVDPTLDAWVRAWSTQCTGFQCEGLRPGFWNSVKILVPSVAAAISLGAITGYALSFWRIPGAGLVFVGLLLAKFIPTQVFVLPLVIAASRIGIYGTLSAVVVMHAIFELAVMTLLFRNYFVSIPIDLIKAARVDGAGFFRTFFYVVLPMSGPIVIVALILLTTSIWNDYLFGMVFAGETNLPMTVQLNNMVNSDQGVRSYDTEMAAVFITTLVPLLVYAVSGRWFVRGIAAGAVKG
jgi:glucose/mannose transport system permease protein